jgi:hypothetical protein
MYNPLKGMNDRDNKAQLTKNLLQVISYHLSRNKASASESYRVIIGNHYGELPKLEGQHFMTIMVETVALCFRHQPGKKRWYSYQGKLNRKIPVMQHIIFDHFPEISTGVANGNETFVRWDTLEPGVYDYVKSVSGKNRRWFKIK